VPLIPDDRVLAVVFGSQDPTNWHLQLATPNSGHHHVQVAVKPRAPTQGCTPRLRDTRWKASAGQEPASARRCTANSAAKARPPPVCPLCRCPPGSIDIQPATTRCVSAGIHSIPIAIFSASASTRAGADANLPSLSSPGAAGAHHSRHGSGPAHRPSMDNGLTVTARLPAPQLCAQQRQRSAAREDEA